MSSRKLELHIKTVLSILAIVGITTFLWTHGDIAVALAKIVFVVGGVTLVLVAAQCFYMTIYALWELMITDARR